MATTEAGFPKPKEIERSEIVSTWIVAILACSYFAWTAVSLYRSTAAFSDLYISLNSPLKGSTWFVIHNYRWFYPCLFGSAAALIITKQFFVRRRWASIAVSLAAVVVLQVISGGIVSALYRPLFDHK